MIKTTSTRYAFNPKQHNGKYHYLHVTYLHVGDAVQLEYGKDKIIFNTTDEFKTFVENLQKTI